MQRLPKLSLMVEVLFRVPCRCNSRRPPAPLGARILTNPEHIFQHNMWDHVQWTDGEKDNARLKVEANSKERIPLKEQAKFDQEAYKYWDSFYKTHQNKFFKIRRWLFSEFPELLPPGSEMGESQQMPTVPSGETGQSQQGEIPSHQHTHATRDHCQLFSPKAALQPGGQANTFPGEQAHFRILEVGCGTGNSVFPIINSIRGSGAFLYCCDFSSCAIQLLKEHPDYDPSVCHAFVQDVSREPSCFPFPPLSLDVILLVFVLSAIHPERIQAVVNRLTLYLKHGGVILFRDYGRYDLSQLRFKKGQCLSDNFYSRQDGTCAYFFTKEDIHHLFTNAGLEEIQNLEDRRIQVNRRKKIVMHRVWMQSKYRKPQSIPQPD